MKKIKVTGDFISYALHEDEKGNTKATISLDVEELRTDIKKKLYPLIVIDSVIDVVLSAIGEVEEEPKPKVEVDIKDKIELALRREEFSDRGIEIVFKILDKFIWAKAHEEKKSWYDSFKDEK